jgi:hypothetical protein
MPVTTNFSNSQSAGDLSIAILTDISTGSGSTITGRLVEIRKYNGSFLVPDGVTTAYVFWPYVAGTGDTINIDILDKDYCLEISVVSYSGSSIYQTTTRLCLFTGYGDLFLRQLTQALSSNLTTITAYNFWYNKNKLRVLLDDAAQAVSLLNDQTIAQFCLDEEKKLTDNIQAFF